MNQSQPNAKFENSEGFSLLETAIALVIMMVLTLGTASLYVYATNYNAGASSRSAALAIAQQKMERLRSSGFDDVLMAAGTTTEVVTYVDHQYTLNTTICNAALCGGSSTMKIITVQVVPQGSKAWMNAPVTLVAQRATGVIGPYVQ